MRKRGNGEGSIYKRKDGYWVAAISTGGHRKHFLSKSRQDVQQRLSKALNEQQAGTLTTGKRQTVEQFLERWLSELQLRPMTIASYRQKIRLHVIPAIGRIALDKLTPAQVNTLLRAKEQAGHSPQNVAHIRAVLRAALNKAIRWNLVGRNAAALADPPRIQQYEAQYLTTEQARAFLDAAKGERLEALYSVALSLGLREGEALGLRWADVDFAARTVRVAKSLQRVPGAGMQLVEPKTKRSQRTLPMFDIVARALRAHRIRQTEERLFAGSAWVDTDLVFTTLEGRPLSPSHVISGSFHRVCRKAGVTYGTRDHSGLRFHDLRHSAASILLAQGIPARTVMEQLGHSQVALTLNRYTHVPSALMEEAAKAMDRALGS
ncbi:MAG TPA: site-specific integrase [Chloroflexi bacterium]|nr:site-specific integrase [Chloroflexota bacterium]HAL26368.1 site-specific integrase [Chloroflexota bacterium]